jgi:hypothetical protein
MSTGMRGGFMPPVKTVPKVGDSITVNGERVTVTAVEPWAYGLMEVHYRGHGIQGSITVEPEEGQ